MINTIKGGIAKDHRGHIRFANDFDMTMVKRFYIIKNADLDVVRGWRAHRIEQRWFYVLSGSFQIDIVQIDNWETTSPDLPIERRVLNANDGELLHIPTGYGTAFQALDANSELLVFADHAISNATKDDHTYPVDYFIHRL